MRLDRFVANNSGLSRKEATLAIRAGRVLIDDNRCTQSNTATRSGQTITLDGKSLNEATPIYWMLNKPKGAVCANTDADHPTVFDLLNLKTLHPSHRNNLQIAGRLDIDTTGLVLITSDGDWNHAITSPQKVLGKRYRVTTAEPISADAIEQLQNGMQLRNDTKPTKPAKVTPLTQNCCLLEITEGRYHQVKRMLAATGNKVNALHREAVAHIELDSTLTPGQYRPLTPAEINLP